MLKQFLESKIEHYQRKIDILESWLPAIMDPMNDLELREKELRVLKNDMHEYALKRDYYHALLNNDYNYNPKSEEYIPDEISTLTKHIEAVEDEYGYYLASGKIKEANEIKDKICRLSYMRDLYLNFNISK